ncbi:MAG: hypothetical protein AB8B55_10720 [Mariniblastus sp.]
MNANYERSLWVSSFSALLVILISSLGALGMRANEMAARKMGTETIGNAPLAEANYKAWPNVMPVINNKSRVYHTWVNGDELFYYHGSVDQLNQLLIDFAKLTAKKKEVVILPQREKVSTFDQSKSFAFNSQLHLVGGIAKSISDKPKGNIYWPTQPQLTIHVVPDLDLKAIEIPTECTLVSLAELKTRYKDGLTSEDQNVRGWGIGHLARLDRFDVEVLNVVAEKASQKDEAWVALNAISSIASFGPKAKSHIPALQKIAAGEYPNNAAAAAKAIGKIDSVCETKAAAEFAEKEATFREQAKAAALFVENHQ